MAQQPTISTVEQLRELEPAPCGQALAWLDESGITELADAWDRCHRGDWMLWICSVLGLLSDRECRLIACRCVRETPLGDGRKVWDLLVDESRRAVAIAERYADGDATDEELAAAYAAAEAAYTAVAFAAAARADTSAVYASAAARAAAAYVAAAYEAAEDAAYAIATAAARAAARAAQADIVREIAGNPFRDSAAA